MEETLVFPSWLDLPEPLSELVLERLPLVDYIRFAAVCPKWRSIQRGHRLRHAPHPPPMANQLPWLAPSDLDQRREMEFYSLSDRKSYFLPIPSSLEDTRCLASCRGWLLLLHDINCGTAPTSKQPIFLFNPITTAQIPLPPLLLIPWLTIGAMSTTPTDPDCVVLLMYDCCAFLYWPNDHCATDWMIIQLPTLQRLTGVSVIHCRGKFYCSHYDADKLYVIDPFIKKGASLLVMRYPHRASTQANVVSLQEIGGELFSVQSSCTSGAIRRYRVFKADFSSQEWLTVETIGDHMLFLGYVDCLVSSLAANVGFKKNSIYSPKDLRRDGAIFAWGVFDLGIGGWTEEDRLMNIYLGTWFVPTLDFANPAKASN